MAKEIENVKSLGVHIETNVVVGKSVTIDQLMDEEGLQNTENELIHIGKPIQMDDEWFKDKLKELDKASRQETDRMKEIVAEIVPTYHFKRLEAYQEALKECAVGEGK